MNNEKSPYLDSNGSAMEPTDILNELKDGLKRFLEGRSAHPHATEARRHELANTQHPQVAILTCSDSRVPVEVIFDAGFGDLFVIRNAGNTNTFGSAGSIEYAVQDLKVKVVVVMSHQGCGAIKAAYLKNQIFSPSLTHLVSDIRNGLTEAGICVNDESCYPDACIQHSAITAQSLINQSKVIHDSVKEGSLLLQPAFLHIDPLSITWLKPFYGEN